MTRRAEIAAIIVIAVAMIAMIAVIGHTLLQDYVNDGICQAALGPESEWVTGNYCTPEPRMVPGYFW